MSQPDKYDFFEMKQNNYTGEWSLPDGFRLQMGDEFYTNGDGKKVVRRLKEK